ncbi:MAG: nucleoside deaminase, partial [Candidatus Omnitrophota bacterium]
MINTSELDTHYMRQALRQAQKAYEANEVPVGALAVLDKRILGQAYNQTMLLKDPTAHAEILAKTQAAGALGKERLDGVTVYVTIEPCPMCLGAMIQARIARLVFGAREPKTGACGSVVNLMAEAK